MAQAGEEIIDSVRFSFEPVADAETSDPPTIGLPDARILIAGDIIFNRVHAFIAEQRFDGWTAAITALEQRPYDIVLPSHDRPGDRRLYAATRDYLAAARTALAEASGPEDLDHRLDAAFPDYDGTVFHPVQNENIACTWWCCAACCDGGAVSTTREPRREVRDRGRHAPGTHRRVCRRPAARRRLGPHSLARGLTGHAAREREVLGMTGEGLDPRAIADQLVVSRHTARGHVNNIMTKLGAHSQLQAVVIAARSGLLPANMPPPLNPAR
jgi:DNA-binding CsgD family transcriptional regulator